VYSTVYNYTSIKIEKKKKKQMEKLRSKVCSMTEFSASMVKSLAGDVNSTSLYNYNP
jgi:hypothetical protein